MATAVIMPKQGQSVESCIIVDWRIEPGDDVAVGDILCEVETDKAVLEVESPISGTLLELFFQAGDLVPVLVNIAAIGSAGEDIGDLRPLVTNGQESSTAPAVADSVQMTETGDAVQTTGERAGISPRARRLAEYKQVELATVQGSGPGGRIIERDVQAALDEQPRMSPVARSMIDQGEYTAPSQGSGPGGRVMSRDLAYMGAEAGLAEPSERALPAGGAEAGDDIPINTIPLKGVRKVIADRMLSSVQSTAQLTLNASADARAILRFRKVLKESKDLYDVQGVTINDLVLFAVSRVLPHHPALNAWFDGNEVAQFAHVQLAFAVDTPRGLIVPVIRLADQRTLRDLAREGKRLSQACLEGKVAPDELTGGTITVTNLGSMGIESFTPILNPPQVAILGVGNIQPKAVAVGDDVQFIPHIGLSLTINHQVVDGAPGARFLQALAQGIAEFDLLLAV